MKNNNKGITLIALVVTIIVLLILAGVSIAMLTGENGILKNAKTAQEKSAEGSLDEAAKIAVGNILTKELAWPYKGNETDSTTPTLAEVQKTITDEITSVNSGIEFGANPWSAQDGTKYILTATVNNKEESIIIDLATGAITEAK